MNYYTKVIKLDSNIAKSKNKALKEFLKSDKKYIFLIEENCKVVDDSVYQKFIEASEATGIHALMWARQDVNKRLPFDDDKWIQYYADFVSSFSMFTKEAVETVGFMDEEMPPNTWQDLEYAKRVGDKELSTPFGMFAAPRGIDNCFKITKPEKEYKNIGELDAALKYWESKQLEDFPIEIKNKEAEASKPVLEML